MSEEPLIRVENVSKRFCRDLKRSLLYGVQDVTCEALGIDRSESGLRRDEFWANRDISFELRRGECLGLIGHNGAGKTTLLKMLNGLIKPDRGRIEIKGRVGALIALGAGFNPILTGRENVYINGSVLGLTKREIDEKFDEIVDFAEIGEFIDAPVQSYSSGMQVRLGFAVATALEPDVLLIDEVLAVGDARFRFKSAQRISKILEDSAVIFVSHNETLVKRIATTGLFLSEGRVLAGGNTPEVYEYVAKVESTNRREESRSKFLHKDIREIEISGPSVLNFGSDVDLEIEVNSSIEIAEILVRVVFRNSIGEIVAEYNSDTHNVTYPVREGHNRLTVKIQGIRFLPGSYSTSVVAQGLDYITQYFRADDHWVPLVKGAHSGVAHVQF